MKNLLGETPDPQMQQKFSNQLNVNAQTPMTFLFATTGDATVPVENSLDFYRALERAHVPVEIHIYDYADHGCGLCGSIPSLETWPLVLRNWLIYEKWLPKDAPPLPPAAPNYPSWPAGLDGPGKAATACKIRRTLTKPCRNATHPVSLKLQGNAWMRLRRSWKAWRSRVKLT